MRFHGRFGVSEGFHVAGLRGASMCFKESSKGSQGRFREFESMSGYLRDVLRRLQGVSDSSGGVRSVSGGFQASGMFLRGFQGVSRGSQGCFRGFEGDARRSHGRFKGVIRGLMGYQEVSGAFKVSHVHLRWFQGF